MFHNRGGFKHHLIFSEHIVGPSLPASMSCVLFVWCSFTFPFNRHMFISRPFGQVQTHICFPVRKWSCLIGTPLVDCGKWARTTIGHLANDLCPNLGRSDGRFYLTIWVARPHMSPVVNACDEGPFWAGNRHFPKAILTTSAEFVARFLGAALL